jgi:hypothetical protein
MPQTFMRQSMAEEFMLDYVTVLNNQDFKKKQKRSL